MNLDTMTTGEIDAALDAAAYCYVANVAETGETARFKTLTAARKWANVHSRGNRHVAVTFFDIFPAAAHANGRKAW